MKPILFKLGPITVYTYGVFSALAILLSVYLFLNLCERRGINRKLSSDIAFWSILAGILGARIFFFLYNPQFLRDPFELLKIWKGGLVWYGGVLFGGITALFLAKKNKIPVSDLADACGVSLAVGLGIGRIGCTMAGCCYGIECHLPIAIVFKDPMSSAPIGVPLWPTQIISSIANFLIGLVLFLRFDKEKPGNVFLLYLFMYGTFRFLIEFIRATPKIVLGMFSVNQVGSIIIALIGLSGFLLRRGGKNG